MTKQKQTGRDRAFSRLTRRSTSFLIPLAAVSLSPLGCGSTSDDGPASGGASGGAATASGAAASTGGKSGGSGGKAGAGGSGGLAGSGGRFGAGGGDGGGTTGGAAGEPGVGLGGQSAICELPFEGGDCDGAFRVYYHNAQTDRCEPAVYGGCGGNENRFETLTECEQFCGVARTEAACEVQGVTYPSGSSGVPDPTSCNTCSCDDGELSGCTENDCPEEPCPDGSISGTECAECGPTDACIAVRYGCFAPCGATDECPGGGVCQNGTCHSIFGFCG